MTRRRGTREGLRPTVVVVSMPVGLGGSVRSVINLLTYLEGLATRVVVGPPSGRVVEVVHERGAVDTYLPYASARESFRVLLRVGTALRVTWWVARRRRDVKAIHANGLSELTIALPAAVLLRVPVIVWVHQFQIPRSLRGRPWAWLLERTPVRWAAVSRLAADLVIDGGLARPEDVTVVPNPIDPGDLVAAERTADAGGAVRVAYVGTPAVYKGFQHLPAIIAAAHGRGATPLSWHVFSRQNGADMADTWDRLRAMTATHDLTLEGKTTDVAGIYARCDIVLVPSESESFCRVAAEAMINAIPVVGTDLEPLRALLGDDEAGLIVPVGDVEAAADSVARLADDPELRRRLGAAGRGRVAEYGPDRVRDRFLELFGIDRPPVEPVGEAGNGARA